MTTPVIGRLEFNSAGASVTEGRLLGGDGVKEGLVDPLELIWPEAALVVEDTIGLTK